MSEDHTSPLNFQYPAVVTALNGQRAILVDHIETDRFPEPNHQAFFVQAVVQLTPRSEPSWAKVLVTAQLKVFWDKGMGQRTCWTMPFDEALPGLAFLGFGESLDHNDVPPHPGGTRYGFVELTSDVFDILKRPAATDDELVTFLKGKIYWTWRFKFPETLIGLPDATRLGVSVPDLAHAAFRHEGDLWTRSGDSSFKPTPNFIRMMETSPAPDMAIDTGSSADDQVYDVALSFAGEQRSYVKSVAEILAKAGVRVFYDNFEDLWGTDLTKRLEDVYRRRSRYIVVFVSKEYIAKAWTNLERQHTLAGRIERQDDSVLPARFEPLDLPGLPATVGHLDISRMPPAELADRIMSKMRRTS